MPGLVSLALLATLGAGLPDDGARWIWGGWGAALPRPGGEIAYLRREFHLDAAPSAAVLRLLVDDSCVVWVNGERVAERAAGRRRSHRIDVTAALRPGPNAIAIEARNEVSDAGVLAFFDALQPGGRVVRIATDRRWASAPLPAVGWFDPGFDDSGWAPAAEVGDRHTPRWAGPWWDAGLRPARTPAGAVSPTPAPSDVPVWQEELWIERRAGFRSRRDRDRGAVVFLGDSITNLWTDVEADWAPLPVANRGIGGDTTSGVFFRLQEDVLDLEPRAIVLLVGTNDLGIYLVEPEAVARNLARVLDEIERARPATPVVLCKLLPRSFGPIGIEAAVRAANRAFEAIARDRPTVTLVDTWSPFFDAEGRLRSGEFPDGLHPSRAGYLRLRAALRPALAALGLPAGP